MLTHLEPQDPETAKNAKSTKHRKTRGFLALPGGSAAGAAAPLSYGEERTAVRQCHGQGAPGRIMRLTPDSRAPAKADPWKVCVGCNPCPCSGVVVVVVVVVVFFFVVVVVGRCWPYLGAGLPLSWP